MAWVFWRRTWPVWTFVVFSVGLLARYLMRPPEPRLGFDGNCIARSLEEYQRLLEDEVHYPWEAGPDLRTALTRMRDQPDMLDSVSLCDCGGQVAVNTAWYGAKWQGYASDGRLDWAVEFTDIGAYCGRGAYRMRFGPHPGGRETCDCAPLHASNLDDPAFQAAIQRGDAAALVRLLAGSSPTRAARPYPLLGWPARLYEVAPWLWGARKRK